MFGDSAVHASIVNASHSHSQFNLCVVRILGATDGLIIASEYQSHSNGWQSRIS